MMKLWIDDKVIEAKPGQTLLDLIKELGLDSPELSSRPLAAKIAGEIFTLNYVPVRQSVDVPEKSDGSFRRQGQTLALQRSYRP